MLPFSQTELRILKKLQTPAKVQDFVNAIPFNFERDGVDTIKSPVRTFRENNAHCFEGALLAAYVLSLHGHKPLLMCLKSTDDDFDHVVALFNMNGYWGAVSKTNHAVLRYREPVYKTVRELALSYFHEYFLDSGKKTLRYYTAPLNLNEFEDNWVYADEDLWGIDQEIDASRHFEIVPRKNRRFLRGADQIERDAGKLVEWKK